MKRFAYFLGFILAWNIGGWGAFLIFATPYLHDPFATFGGLLWGAVGGWIVARRFHTDAGRGALGEGE